MRAACVVLIVFAMVSPAWAQSGTGVSVSLVGDIARYNGADSDPYIDGGRSRDGEALGFSLRLDRALASRWGVELEYVRGGEIESAAPIIALPARLEIPTRSLSEAVSSFATFTQLSAAQLTLLAPTTTTTRARMSTASTLAWYRQSVGDRTSLVYSAGVGFGINKTETTFSYNVRPEVLQLTLPPRTTEYTSYTVNPIVGFDARIAMTDHASLVPGIRAIGANGGVIIRPSVGLRWEF